MIFSVISVYFRKLTQMMELLSGNERTRGSLLSFGCRQLRCARRKHQRIHANGLREDCGGCSEAPATAGRVLWLASSCFRCTTESLPRGKGMFLPCNPELLPSNVQPSGIGKNRVPISRGDCRPPVLSPGRSPHSQAPSPSSLHTACPWLCVLRRRGRETAVSPRVCSCVFLRR